MTKKPQTSKDAADKVVKNIRRKTRQTYSAEEKIRIAIKTNPGTAQGGTEIVCVSVVRSSTHARRRSRPPVGRK